MQFNSCSVKADNFPGVPMPQYYPSNVPLLPYCDWTPNQRQHNFPYSRFSYDQSAQISSFLPSQQEKPFKDYHEAVRDTNLSEWYVCQSSGNDSQAQADLGQLQGQNALPVNPSLHQQALTAGF